MSLNENDELRRCVGNIQALQRQPADRLLAQLEFAEGLCDLHPEQANAWRQLIDQARKLYADSLARGDLAAATARAEELLAPIGQVAKTYTIHCVGHAHIDMNWMWSWPETVAVTIDTFTTMLALMDEFPDFCFTQSQASVYAIVRDHAPAMLKRIRARIKEGRWEVAAVHWVEGDKNIAGGEALARHLLYTRRFLADELGLRPQDTPLDWEPDTFGHALTIPTILARGGVRRYYMCRGGNWEKPPVFWYQGPDGARVLVNLETTWYNDHIGPHNTQAMLKFCRKTALRDWLNVYGVGDHGGGPTRRDILYAREMNGWPIFPAFKLATTNAYYEILERRGADWPVIDRELNYEFTGCYTTQTQIKRNNRYGENYCLEGETLAALANRLIGLAYPGQALRDAWVEVLFSHFHDILPGSGVAETRQYNQGTFQRVAATIGAIKTNACRGIAGAVDTSFAGPAPAERLPVGQESIAIGGGVGRGTMLGGMSGAGHVVDGPRPFVIFNPLAQARTETVQATIWDAHSGASPGDIKAKNFVVRDAAGRIVPAQKLATGNYWGHQYVDLAFPVAIAPLAWASYVIEEGAAPEHAPAVVAAQEPRPHVGYGAILRPLENEHLRVEFDKLTGGIVKLVDKATGVDLADPARPMGLLEYTLERPGGMTAWVIGDMKKLECPLKVESLRLVESGPHVARVEAKLKVQGSDVTVNYVLKAGQPWLEINITARWVEIGKADVGIPGLRMRFPAAVEDARATYEIPFGAIRRDLTGGEEVPALRWADVAGRPAGQVVAETVDEAAAPADVAPAGLTLANDSKYGHSLEGSTLRVTLIRSSYDPDPLPEIGDHQVRLAIAPHGRPRPTADLVRMASAINHPLLVVATDVHEGRLPATSGPLVKVAPEAVVLSSLKKAEDGRGCIVRVYETAGKPAKAKLTLDGKLLGTVKDAVEVDLLERPTEQNTAKASGQAVTVHVPAFGIASVRVTFER